MNKYNLSLNENDYIGLVSKGYIEKGIVMPRESWLKFGLNRVKTKSIKINIPKDKFKELIDGKIIECIIPLRDEKITLLFNICLQDIGYDVIYKHLMGTKIYN